MNQPVERNLPLAMAGEALVMMVDDEELVIEVLQGFLAEAGYTRFVSTVDSTRALAIMQRERPQVVLLDIQMPRMSGFQILEALRADPALQHIPVIVLTSADDTETKLKALELGASDFLRKPVDESELVLRLRNTLAAKAYQDYLTYYDRATGLANRQRLMGELERALRQAQARSAMAAVLQLDLDRFSQINEALGPAVGDEIIKQAARRIRGVLQGQEFAARSGGDEFCIVLPSVPNVERAARLAESVLRALAQPYHVESRELHVTASAGLALFPADGQGIDELVKNAGAALQQAKHSGGNVYRFYSREFNDKAAQRLNVEAQLRRALERGELELFYQPKLRTVDRTVCGAEALLRWRHPQFGLVPPKDFIGVAEESGFITVIGEWVLGAACRQLAAWQAAGFRRVPVSVNVSPRQFQPQLVAIVRAAVGVTRQAEHLRLELTESSVMTDPQPAVELLRELKAIGMKLSIDDFGMGYSSLSYLQKLPLDELKIDRSFVSSIASAQSEAPLVDMIIALAHSLGLSVVAEGVESEAQLAYLRERGCDECQGYFFSKPLPAQAFAEKYLA